MHIRTIGELLHVQDELLHLLPVVLVVSQYVNDRLIAKRLQNPFYPVGARMNIAREHNHVGVHIIFLEWYELQMEIA